MRMSSARVVLLLLAACLPGALRAQRAVSTQQLLGYGYHLTLALSAQSHLQSEVQERRFIVPFAQHQFLLRSHLHRRLGRRLDLSGGFCLFFQRPNDPLAQPRLAVPELRPHAEALFRSASGRWGFEQRFRAEARFYRQVNASRSALEAGYRYSNLRLRYRAQAALLLRTLGEDRCVKLKISDEIHLNALRQGDVPRFDQNRLFAGLSADLRPGFSLDIGYLNWFQQRAAASCFSRHILSLGLSQRLALPKQRR